MFGGEFIIPPMQDLYRSDMQIVRNIRANGPDRLLRQDIFGFVAPELEKLDATISYPAVRDLKPVVGVVGLAQGDARRELAKSALSDAAPPPVRLSHEEVMHVTAEKPVEMATINLLISADPTIASSQELLSRALSLLSIAESLADPLTLKSLNDHLRFKQGKLNVYVMKYGLKGLHMHKLEIADGVLSAIAEDGSKSLLEGTVEEEYLRILHAPEKHTANEIYSAREVTLGALAQEMKTQNGFHFDLMGYTSMRTNTSEYETQVIPGVVGVWLNQPKNVQSSRVYRMVT